MNCEEPIAVEVVLASPNDVTVSEVINAVTVDESEPTRVYVSVPGVAGNQGPQGPRGYQGPQGSQGPQGFQGVQGRLFESETPPANPVAGDMWFKSSTGIVYAYYDSFWVELGSGSQGTQGFQGPQGAQGLNANQMNLLQRWHKDFGRVREGLVKGTGFEQSTDVLWVGDSISEGWTTDNSNSTIVNVFTDNIARIANPKGRCGRWVPAGGDWFIEPKFTNNTGSTLYINHEVLGSGSDAYFVDNKVYLSESFATSNFLNSGVGNITQLYVGTARISWTGKESGVGGRTVLTGVQILSYFFYSGTIFSAGSTVATGGSDTIVRGLSLRSRSLTPMTTYDPANAYFTTTLSASASAGATTITVADASNIPTPVGLNYPSILIDSEILQVTAKSGNDLTVLRGRFFTTAASHSNGATVKIQKLDITGESCSLDFTGDNIVVHYRLANIFGMGRIKFDLYQKDVSTGNYDIPVVSSGDITTLKGSPLPSDGHELTYWDANEAFGLALPRADYRLIVSQFSPNTVSNNGLVLFDGAYFFDGNTDQGVRVWNSSKYGANFNSFNSIVDTVKNDDWLSALRNNLVDPSLVVIALGTNEAATTDGLIGGPSNASVVEARLREMVDDIKAAYAVGFPGNPEPSFAFFVPPADSTSSSSDWDLIQARYQLVAQDIGAAIWDWAEFTGDVNYKYALVGNLASAINSSQTTVVTSATPKYVATGNTLLIDSEKVYVSAINGASLTVQRGYSSTSAASHNKSSRVFNFGLEVGTGDPQTWTVDNVHPNADGHRAIGDFATSEALASVEALNTLTTNIPDEYVENRHFADDSINPIKITGLAVIDSDSRLTSKIVAAGAGSSYNNSNARTALLSTTLSNVATGDIYRLRAWGVCTNNTGSAMNVGLDLNFGPTGTSVMPTSGLSIGSNAFNRHWFYDLEIYVADVSAGQLLNARMSFSTTNTLGTNAMSAALGSSFYFGNGDATTTQDLTGTPTLGLYSTLATASVNASINCLGYTLTKVV